MCTSFLSDQFLMCFLSKKKKKPKTNKKIPPKNPNNNKKKKKKKTNQRKILLPIMFARPTLKGERKQSHFMITMLPSHSPACYHYEDDQKNKEKWKRTSTDHETIL